MNYHEHRLAPPLDAFIECIWFLSGAAGEPDVRPPAQRILPDGCAELIFHFGERFHAVSTPGAPRQPAAFIVGLLTSPLIVAPAARVDTMAVRFRPGGAYPFFAVPLSALTDSVVSLEDLWGPAPARRLWEQLAATSGELARASCLSRELGRRRIAREDNDRIIASAIADLVRTAGCARIASIAARAGTTRRQLQRRFSERVGVSPKTLARILRFQRTLLQRARPDHAGTDWVRVAVECGYTDQSHLIHDYAAFAGETPATLLAAESELSTYFTAPQRLAALFRLPL